MARALGLAALLAGLLLGLEAVRGGSTGAVADHPVVSYRSAVAADAHTLARQTTPFQREILADGRVTYAEYASATRATVACMRGSGLPFRITRIRRAPGAQLEYSWRLTHSAENQPRVRSAAMRVFQRCSVLWEADVKLIYANQRVIPAAERSPVLAKLVACLRRANLAVVDRPSMQGLIAVVDGDRHGRGERCAKRYYDLFRIPAPMRPAREMPLAR